MESNEAQVIYDETWLTAYEQRVLMIMSGLVVETDWSWGAAVTSCLESLVGYDFVSHTVSDSGVRYELTATGIQLAEKLCQALQKENENGN